MNSKNDANHNSSPDTTQIMPEIPDMNGAGGFPRHRASGQAGATSAYRPVQDDDASHRAYKGAHARPKQPDAAATSFMPAAAPFSSHENNANRAFSGQPAVGMVSSDPSAYGASRKPKGPGAKKAALIVSAAVVSVLAAVYIAGAVVFMGRF
ncbi:MAG: hypothetical protein Q4B69_06870 [Slackia sp.]|nr:hypothetical protein [Slackia sp.]